MLKHAPRQLTLLVVCAGLWPAVSPALASAGTFDVTSCSVNAAAPGEPLAVADDAWSYVTNDETHFQSSTTCPPATDRAVDGLVAQGRINSQGAARHGFAEWRFDAVPYTAITRVRLQRNIGKRENGWALYTRTADGTDLPDSDCKVEVNEFTCEITTDRDWVITRPTTAVRVGLECNASTCTTGSTRPHAWSAIHRAIVTVEDNEDPSASGAGGSLLAGGYLRGTVTATLDAASDNTGIRAVQVKLGDNEALVAQTPRACDFTRRVPCDDLTSPATVDVDTTTIPDGTHTVAVGALDPAGNFTAAASRPITVDNTPPTAPTPTSPQQQSATAPSATVTWANPTGQVAPVTVAHITFCGPSGCSTHTEPVSGATGRATLSLPGPGAYNVGVAVADAAGNFDPTQVAGWNIAYPATTAGPMAPGPSPAPTAPGGTPAPAPTAPPPAPPPASPRDALAQGRGSRRRTRPPHDHRPRHGRARGRGPSHDHRAGAHPRTHAHRHPAHRDPQPPLRRAAPPPVERLARRDDLRALRRQRDAPPRGRHTARAPARRLNVRLHSFAGVLRGVVSPTPPAARLKRAWATPTSM
jgi:hypothetical protein